MSAPARVTAVIPAYNVEEWIGGAIESLLSQGDLLGEVIVVDDGSTDGTAATARALPRTNVVDQDHRGVSAARNAGIDLCETDLIMLLDADDELLPGALSKLVGEIDRDPGASAVIPNARLEGPDGSAGSAWPMAGETMVLDRGSVRRLISHHWLQPNALVKTPALKAVHFDQGLKACEDTDVWARLLLSGHRLVVLREPMVLKRSGRPAAATSNLSFMRTERKRFYDKLLAGDLSRSERLSARFHRWRSSVGARVAGGMLGAERE
jgi:glycosyltransferase involved in cell wall biosynthesis